MSSEELDTRLRVAWKAVQAARTARLREKLLPAALRASERARGLLARAAPDLAADADRLTALVRAAATLNDPTDGDPRSFVREVEVLRAERVPTHLVARSAIRVGACAGPLTPTMVKACATKLRQQRLRLRRSRP